MSVVNLVKTTPWIPGQQLYGAMIPRPEEEAKLHQGEALRQDENLTLIRRRVRQIRRNTGVPDKGRLRLKKGHESQIPASFGYEVALLDEPHP